MDELEMNEMLENPSTVLGCIDILKQRNLSREEELLLGTKMQGDPALVWEFCSHYLLWAAKLAKWLYSSVRYDPAFSYEDILLMTICEMATAAERYRPYQARFTTCSFTYIVNNVRQELHLKKSSGSAKRRPEAMVSFDLFYQGSESYDLHQRYSLEDHTLDDSEIIAEFSQFGTETAQYLHLWIINNISISEIARSYGVSRHHVDRMIKKALNRLREMYQPCSVA